MEESVCVWRVCVWAEGCVVSRAGEDVGVATWSGGVDERTMDAAGEEEDDCRVSVFDGCCGCAVGAFAYEVGEGEEGAAESVTG